MFKALLKNKPQQKPESGQVRKEVRESIPKPGSEDAMYKVLLKNKQQQAQHRESTPAVTPPVEVHETEIPVAQIKTAPLLNTAQADAIVESIQSLNAGVNMIHGLMKTLIAPLLVLILIVGIAILFKGII